MPIFVGVRWIVGVPFSMMLRSAESQFTKLIAHEIISDFEEFQHVITFTNSQSQSHQRYKRTDIQTDG